jgi:hypothetical protein
MKSKFPYEEFKTTPIWEVFDKAIQDLASNSDIEEKTDRSYIVGYLCKTLIASGIVNK